MQTVGVVKDKNGGRRRWLAYVCSVSISLKQGKSPVQELLSVTNEVISIASYRRGPLIILQKMHESKELCTKHCQLDLSWAMARHSTNWVAIGKGFSSAI